MCCDQVLETSATIFDSVVVVAAAVVVVVWSSARVIDPWYSTVGGGEYIEGRNLEHDLAGIMCAGALGAKISIW